MRVAVAVALAVPVPVSIGNGLLLGRVLLRSIFCIHMLTIMMPAACMLRSRTSASRFIAGAMLVRVMPAAGMLFSISFMNSMLIASTWVIYLSW